MIHSPKKSINLKQIPLTQGRFALVDDSDYDFLMQWKWYARFDPTNNTWYAVRKKSIDGRQTTLQMHRIILGLTDSKIKCDHKNGEGLDNQRQNLRPCTNAQNCKNRKLNSNSATGFKGVHFNKRQKKYAALIIADKKRISLGYYRDAIDAAKAYNEAAKIHHGEFARLNKI